MKLARKNLMALAVLGVASVATSSQAAIIFRDTFNTSSGSENINFEIASRQTGSAVSGGPISYSEDGVSSGITRNENWQTQVGTTNLLMASTVDSGNVYPNGPSPYLWVSPNKNFVTSDFILSLDMLATGGTMRSGLIFGSSSQSAKSSVTDGIGISFSGDAYTVYNNTVSIKTGTGNYDNAAASVVFSVVGSGSDALVSLALDGVTIDLNGVTAGTAYTRVGGFTSNYLNLQVESTVFAIRNFDNLELDSSVPEPASLGVLALGGLALLGRRRK